MRERIQGIRRMAVISCCVMAVAPAVSCGGATKRARSHSGESQFGCSDRRVEYMVVGGMAGAEASIIMDCAEAGPRIRTWKVLNNAGDRNETSHSLSTGEFEDLWDKADTTGWRNLSGDCANPEANPTDPIYTILVQKDDLSVEMTCTGRPLPFPYNTFVDELDLLAAEQR